MNLDANWYRDAQAWWHLPTSVRAVVYGPSNCSKMNVLINLLENPHGIQFENVYSKLLQQPILGEFVSEEIDYFIFSNNRDVIPLSEALPNSFFIFNDMWQAGCDKRIFCNRTTHGCRLFLFIVRCTQRYRSTLYATIQICWSYSKYGTNLKRVYNYMNTDMSYEDISAIYVVNIGRKVWISSNWQGQCAYWWAIQDRI